MAKLLKFLLSACIICLFLFLSYFLCIRLISQTYSLLALNDIRDKNYTIAIKYLNRAISYQPTDYSLWAQIGKAYYNLGTSKSAKDAFNFAQKSKRAYQAAVQLNPMDAESFYGLSISEARLETLHPFVHYKTENPYNAIPYFFGGIAKKIVWGILSFLV